MLSGTSCITMNKTGMLLSLQVLLLCMQQASIQLTAGAGRVMSSEAPAKHVEIDDGHDMSMYLKNISKRHLVDYGAPLV